MPIPMEVLDARQRDVVFLLAGHGVATNVDIAKTLREEADERVAPERLAASLDDLLVHGFVDRESVEDGDAGELFEYRLTERGREEINRRLAWQHDLLDDAECEDG